MGGIRRRHTARHGKSLAREMSPRNSATSASLGKWAERLAQDHLRANGLEALSVNYRCRHGEIDLIMRDGSTIVFVEVRFRKSSGYGSGAETVTAAKQVRLIATANHYLQHTECAMGAPCRFDVVAVSDSTQRPDIDWIKDAFESRELD